VFHIKPQEANDDTRYTLLYCGFLKNALKEKI